MSSLKIDNPVENDNDPVISDKNYLEKSYVKHITDDEVEIQGIKRKLKELPEGYSFEFLSLVHEYKYVKFTLFLLLKNGQLYS